MVAAPALAGAHRRAFWPSNPIDADARPAGGCIGRLLAHVQTLAEDHRDAGRVTVPAPEAGVLDGTPFGLAIVTPPPRLEGLSDVVEAGVRPTSNRLPDRHECRARGPAFGPTL
jgi:hypothetical protein